MFEFIGNCVLSGYNSLAEIPRKFIEKRKHAELLNLKKEAELEQQHRDKRRESEMARKKTIDRLFEDAIARSNKETELEKKRVVEFKKKQSAKERTELYNMALGLRPGSISKNSSISYKGKNYNVYELLKDIDALPKLQDGTSPKSVTYSPRHHTIIEKL